MDVKVVVVSFPEEPTYVKATQTHAMRTHVASTLAYKLSCAVWFEVGMHCYVIRLIPYQPQELEIKKAGFLKSRLVKQGLKELPFDSVLEKSAQTFEVEESLVKEFLQACTL
jgi:hypothetical protein